MISTHLITDVEQILDEVVMIREGNLMLHSSVDEIRNKMGEIHRQFIPGGVPMLGKLLKYDIKANWIYFLIMYGRGNWIFGFIPPAFGNEPEGYESTVCPVFRSYGICAGSGRVFNLNADFNRSAVL